MTSILDDEQWKQGNAQQQSFKTEKVPSKSSHSQKYKTDYFYMLKAHLQAHLYLQVADEIC